MKTPWIVGGVLMFLSVCALAAAKPTDDCKFYNEHIIAVDSDGSAYMPNVTCTRDAAGKAVKYTCDPKVMDGERPQDFPLEAKSKEWRKPYYEYIHCIFSEIERVKPKHVVIYIHGGMNFVTGAICKGAELADECRGRENEEYRIAICWSSNLFSTYGEHLYENFEGLSDRSVAMSTLPLTLLSDFGGALASAPKTLTHLLANDLHTANQQWFHRTRRAYERESELETKETSRPDHALKVSLGEDPRESRPGAEAADVGAWLGTLPAKVATAPLIEGLGTGAWQMMLRRTRTMFERETSFTSDYFDKRHPEIGVRIVNGQPVRNDSLRPETVALIEKVIHVGRRGAVRLFFEEAQRELGLGSDKRTRVFPGDLTIIGHSMGTIVANEILARFGRIKFDNIVYMAAACRTEDFLRLGVPYLERYQDVHFYNLCLHPSAERTEAQPGKLMIADPLYFPLEIAPRGSLLVWIDSFLEHPESEGDRTLGRWENAILASDIFPKDVNSRITIKAFGRDRFGNVTQNYSASGEPRLRTSGGLNPRQYLNEPREHGDFSRDKFPANPKNPNFDFTEPNYWKVEPVGK